MLFDVAFEHRNGILKALKRHMLEKTNKKRWSLVLQAYTNG